MKKDYILTCLTGLVISLLLLALCLNFEKSFVCGLSECVGLTGKNLMVNADFKEGLKGWEHHEGISVITSNSFNYVCIENNSKQQVRIWQSINVISGKTYRLTFNLTGPDKGAFAIYRNAKSGKEQYVWCNGKNNHKYYSLNVKPTRSGKDLFYLSTNGTGKYFFSNVKLKQNKSYVKNVCLFIAVLGIILSSILLLRFNTYFFILVFLLAFIPILKINKDLKSESENRTLAIYKPFIDGKHKINKNYGTDFNNWINDHFWIRNDLMKNQNSLKYLIDGKIDNKFVFQGKDKWLFLKGNIRRMAKPDSYYESIYEDTAKAIKRFNDFCANNNAKLYIVLAPFGEEVYSEEIPNLYIANRVGRFGKYTDRLQADTSATVIYALDSLLNAKTNALVQYKTDHHWTQLGAWNAYEELRTKIFQDFNITQAYNTPFKLKSHKYNFGYGETFVRVKNVVSYIAKKIYPRDAVYLKFITNKDFHCDNNGSRIINKNGVNKKIFLFGDSYTRNIKNFFGYDFLNTKYMEKPLQIYMPKFEKEIATYKPDIVVLTIYSQNFDLIKNWYKQ